MQNIKIQVSDLTILTIYYFIRGKVNEGALITNKSILNHKISINTDNFLKDAFQALVYQDGEEIDH